LEVIAPITAIPVVAVPVIIFYMGRTRADSSSGIIQSSHLECENCGGEFDYIQIGPS
jgi:hypothetical protein